jgi:hypothetical protein
MAALDSFWIPESHLLYGMLDAAIGATFGSFTEEQIVPLEAAHSKRKSESIQSRLAGCKPGCRQLCL